MNPKSKIFHDAQWFIYRSEPYNFVCKGGHNSEPHNHNDVGSFIISKNGKVTFTDPGGGEYTRQYFAADTRYKHLCCSSRGHSVPIINGCEQVIGRNKSTVYEETETRYSFSMENAYEISTLTGLKRSFVCEQDGITLTDEYTFSEKPESVVERFVSLTEIVLDGDTAKCGESVIKFDADTLDATVTIGTLERPNSNNKLWMLDLKVKAPSENIKLIFRFI